MYARDYRSVARNNLQNNWKRSILTALIAFLLGGLMVGTSFFPDLNTKVDEEDIRSVQSFFTYVIEETGTTLSILSALSLVQFIIGGVIQLGYAGYLLKQHDRQDPQLNELFSKFDYFGAGFCQAFLRDLYTFLWSLLFLIPGIIANFSYSMTPFIMAEHPDMTASEAIRASKQMMRGHKWALFCLDFSFIGWDLLCALTLNIGHLALNPYKNAAHAAFYRQITQNAGAYQE